MVPMTLQDKVVSRAHEGHQGVTKAKEYLRTRVLISGFGSDGRSLYSALPPMLGSD